jgi:hypothetical protein
MGRMEFRTELFPESTGAPISHRCDLVSIGSCFAERMGERLKHYKFHLLQNPFGILFHPIPMVAPLVAALKGEDPYSANLILQEGKWCSLAFHSRMSHRDKEFLQTMIGGVLQATNRALRKADWVVLTLGSAIGFRHLESGQLAGNCHKLPQQAFVKEFSRVGDLRAAFEEFLGALFAANPKVRVLLTVSPVRHLRSGLVDSAGSKAVLRALCQELTEDFERVDYFPAWELLMDDLRDYRFYGRDLAHPSEVAEDYIWQKFSEAYLSPQARTINAELDGVFRDLAHRPFQPEGEAHQQFLRNLRDKIDRLRSHVDLELELRDLDERMGL